MASAFGIGMAVAFSVTDFPDAEKHDSRANLQRGHGNADVGRGKNRAVSAAVDTVGEPGEPLVQVRPERYALGRRRRQSD
jgi:hypothetical protein